MSTPEDKGRIASPPNPLAPQKKKPYHKPEFRFERVFETTALSCGKVSPTQGQCLHNLKNS